MSGTGDSTGGLYPFLEPDSSGDPDEAHADIAAVLDEVRGSTLSKAAEVTALRARLWEAHHGDIHRGAELLATAFREGKKVLAFGNGGSATDAQDLASDLTNPPLPDWRPLPALALVQDRGVLTAVANDVGFGHVFARQVIAYGEEGDVAVGFSTSGESENVLEAFREAHRRGMATIGFAGYEGGRMRDSNCLDVVAVAPSTHIPRIQEVHATAYHAMLHLTQEILAREEAK